MIGSKVHTKILKDLFKKAKVGKRWKAKQEIVIGEWRIQGDR